MDFVFRLIPGQDQAFRRSFERTRGLIEADGLIVNGPRAAARAEELLRADGYPSIVIEVERTLDEALAHAAHWTVRRDGTPI